MQTVNMGNPQRQALAEAIMAHAGKPDRDGNVLDFQAALALARGVMGGEDIPDALFQVLEAVPAAPAPARTGRCP